MNYSSTSAAGGMLCQSQRGGDANRETGNDDEQFLGDRAANDRVNAGCIEGARDIVPRMLHSATSAFTRVFVALCLRGVVRC